MSSPVSLLVSPSGDKANDVKEIFEKELETSLDIFDEGWIQNIAGQCLYFTQFKYMGVYIMVDQNVDPDHLLLHYPFKTLQRTCKCNLHEGVPL